MDKQKLIKELKEEAQRLAKAARMLEDEWKDVLRLAAKDIESPQGRKQQIIELIRKNGPMRAIELIKAGIPRGTVTAYLSRKNGFKTDGTGRWDYRP